MNMLYRTQDIKVFMMMCSLCQLGPFSLAQSHISISTKLLDTINPFKQPKYCSC